MAHGCCEVASFLNLSQRTQPVRVTGNNVDRTDCAQAEVGEKGTLSVEETTRRIRTIAQGMDSTPSYMSSAFTDCVITTWSGLAF